MKNNYAKALYITGGCILVIGIVGSFILGSVFPSVSFSSYGSYSYESYNWGLVIGGIIGSIISGLLFLGFAELIEIADDIRQKLFTLNTAVQQPSSDKNDHSTKSEAVQVNSSQTAKVGEKDSDEDAVIFDIRPTSEPIVCPRCGTSQRNNRNVCMKCGVKFVFNQDR